MKYFKRNSFFLMVLMTFNGIMGLSQVTKADIVFRLMSSQETQLTIYTYDSLLYDPFYDIQGNFSLHSGIPKTDIQIVRLSDANEIVTRLLAEKDSPQADVVIGVDNALIHLIEDKSDVFESYSPPNITQIDSNLIQNLDPDKYLIPYDYGIISLYYQNHVINSSTHPELKKLTLDSLLESDILSMLIVENPKFSSPGLGFLLWTIAVYGDPEINFNGILGEDWREWWKIAGREVTITKSWGDAFDIFFEASEGKPIMVSYGTSPAYGYCQWGDNSTSAVVTHEKNKANAWLQIEGMGLVKGAPHKENGKEFINWFLGAELQAELPEHQWMYPANTEAKLSECFNQSAISPEEVNRLNDLISPTLLSEHLTQWQDEWEQVVVQQAVTGFDIPITLLGIILVGLTVQLRKRRKIHP
jgi:thiamine transport system substrate-binding protein